jgi:hypothetical protein
MQRDGPKLPSHVVTVSNRAPTCPLAARRRRTPDAGRAREDGIDVDEAVAGAAWSVEFPAAPVREAQSRSNLVKRLVFPRYGRRVLGPTA